MATAISQGIDLKFKAFSGKEINLGCASKIVLTKAVNDIDMIEATLPAMDIDFNKVVDSDCMVFFRYKNKKYMLVDVENVDEYKREVKDKKVKEYIDNMKVRKILDEIRELMIDKFDFIQEDFHLYENSNVYLVLKDIGFDSNNLHELIIAIEDKYKVSILDEFICKKIKFEDLANIIIERSGVKNE
jgi:acyl carrier protein